MGSNCVGRDQHGLKAQNGGGGVLNLSVLREWSRERPNAKTPEGLVGLEGAAGFSLVLFLGCAAWQDPEYEPQQVDFQTRLETPEHIFTRGRPRVG